jgi:hypothetical protein
LRELAAPVSLVGLLQVTEDTNSAWVTVNAQIRFFGGVGGTLTETPERMTEPSSRRGWGNVGM